MKAIDEIAARLAALVAEAKGAQPADNDQRDKVEDVVAHDRGPADPLQVKVIARAFRFSVSGLINAFRSERAFRQEAALLVLAVPTAFLLAPDMFHRAALVGSLLAVMCVELLNTCIERLCDHTTPEFHRSIGAIKDMGSAAVFCALTMAAVLWGAAVVDRLLA